MQEQSGVSGDRGQRAKPEFLLWATEPGDLLLGNQLSDGCLCQAPAAFPGVSQTPTLSGPGKAGRKEKQEPKHSWATCGSTTHCFTVKLQLPGSFDHRHHESRHHGGGRPG